MSKFKVDYQQKLHDEKLHFIDIHDTGDDQQNEQDAWNELRRSLGIHRDNAYIQGRTSDVGLFDQKSEIEYRFIEQVPFWHSGSIEVLAKNEDAAIVEARAVLGGDIAIDNVEEIND